MPFGDNTRHLYEQWRMKEPLDHAQMPQPIYEENPDYVDLYWKAWELAWKHVLYREDVPQHYYIDESLTPSRIWIWDTCFMALYCRYAPELFPGIESLNNFYYVIHDRKSLPFKIHHPDNPPLFAWVEWEYFKHTNDIKRVEWLFEHQYLQKHFHYMENAETNKIHSYAGAWIATKKRALGYQWSGVQSGMDNTPRGKDKYRKILWIDLLAQQALSAKMIIQLATVLKTRQKDDADPSISQAILEYNQYYEQFKKILNENYWDEETGFYYDINKRNKKKVKVMTPASYWPLLAEMVPEERVQPLISPLQNPQLLGGEIPIPTVARNDKQFQPRGMYWRGGVWLPSTYMTIKALEEYGQYKLADELAAKMVKTQLITYQTYDPHTIWECYSPTENRPSTMKHNKLDSRTDFCGWSALGPISLFIENMIGIREIDAPNHTITFNPHSKQKHGVNNLHMAKNRIDLVWEEQKLQIKTDEPIVLKMGEKKYQIPAGQTEIEG